MTTRPSDFDVANMTEIITNDFGDWFSADLLRLIRHADSENREKLRLVYPEHVAAYEKWVNDGD